MEFSCSTFGGKADLKHDGAISLCIAVVYTNFRVIGTPQNASEQDRLKMKSFINDMGQRGLKWTETSKAFFLLTSPADLRASQLENSSGSSIF